MAEAKQSNGTTINTFCFVAHCASLKIVYADERTVCLQKEMKQLSDDMRVMSRRSVHFVIATHYHVLNIDFALSLVGLSSPKTILELIIYFQGVKKRIVINYLFLVDYRMKGLLIIEF